MRTREAGTRRSSASALDGLRLEELRPGQREAVEAVLAGRDTLVVMPTGYGKSAIYQIAAALLPGPTLVVTPLISLQRDQVEGLSGNRVGEAAQANSALTAPARRAAFEELERGRLEFLFLAPEQFSNPETLQRLQGAPPSLFVVDEAHCISSWGHDFRPDYLRLGAVRNLLGRPVVLALTATAAPPVRAEIAERLQMQDPFVIVHGFDRPNIFLRVERFVEESDKWQAAVERAATTQGPGIVYAATRSHTEQLASALRGRGVAAEHYHAGLKGRDRDRVQDAFMQGELEVLAATTAFGMGVDKPDVRFVLHFDVPESLDAYYQELGRAGRDGEPAEAALFFRPEDLGVRRYFAAAGQVEVEQVEQVVEALVDWEGPVAVGELRGDVDLSSGKVTTALTSLDAVGAVELLPAGEVVATPAAESADAAAQAALEAIERRRQLEHSRIEMVRSYAETHDCRRQFLLNYFGEGYQDPCDACDNCIAGRTVVDDPGDHPFRLNSRVTHPAWGEGLVMRYEEDKVTVLFDSVGYRTLALPVVLDRGLLGPVA